MSGHIIRQLEERHVASKVDLMVWSSKMDLLAFSNSKGEVALHRLTWKRVWLLPPPSPDLIVRKLAWRPDSRVIAVAYVPKTVNTDGAVKGEVILVNVENKEILHEMNVSDDVSCLVWLQEKPFSENQQTVTSPPHNQDGTSDFLPKLPSLSRTFTPLPDNAEENYEDAKRIKDQTQLNFLLIGTCDGNVYLSVFGLFSCGIMNVNKYMPPEKQNKHASVLNAEMSHDMKSIFLLVAVDNKKLNVETMNEENEASSNKEFEESNKGNEEALEDGKTDSSSQEIPKEGITTQQIPASFEESLKKRELTMVILDTRVLSSRSRELHALSLKHGHIISLLDYLSQTMRSIIEAWENIYLLEIESKLSKHAESLPEGSFSADLLELLLMGVTSDSLENFLLKELNDKAIKKLGHSIELSHSNIQKLILKHLLSVGQSLAYHLAEMKGMAKLTDRFKVLGLEEETVAEAFSAAGAFLIKSTEVQLVIDESMKRYKAFFKWLYAIILRISDDRIPELTMTDINQQDLEFIADYLNKLDVVSSPDGSKKHCFLDRLGQYLVNEDLSTPNDCDNQWRKLLDANPCLQDHYSIIKRNKTTSLVQQHNLLKQAISNVFRTPEHAIGNMFQMKHTVSLLETESKNLSMCLMDENISLVSLIEDIAPNYVQLIQVVANGEEYQVKRRMVSFKSDDTKLMKCLDAQFYLPDILSVLLEEQDENKTAVISQVMTKPIYESSTDVVDGNSLGDSVVLRQIPDMVASSFAVSGTRKVAIVLSLSRRKVRLFEMEAEDEEEEDEMITLENSGFGDCYKCNSERLMEEEEGLETDGNKSSPKDNSLISNDTSDTSDQTAGDV